METSLQYSLITVIYVTCLVGFTVNLIIVAANFMKWKSLKSLQTCDQILSSLAISRALCFVIIVLRTFIFQCFPWLLHNEILLSILYIQTMLTFYSSHWFTTVLCVFYCVKIVTYNYKLLIFLKTRISTIVLWLIPASLLISLLSSLPIGFYGYDLKLQNSSNGFEHKLVPNFNNQFLIFSVGSFPPFVIFCVANFLLIHFLLIHTRRMRSNESQIQSPNLKSHFDAMKSMSLFLLLQIMLFICMNLVASGRFFAFSKYPIVITSVTLCGAPLFHSLYMISSSKEVRKMFTSMYLYLIRSS